MRFPLLIPTCLSAVTASITLTNESPRDDEDELDLHNRGRELNMFADDNKSNNDTLQFGTFDDTHSNASVSVLDKVVDTDNNVTASDNLSITQATTTMTVAEETSTSQLTSSLEFFQTAQVGTCGNGNIGNGRCEVDVLCCSQFGYCGSTAEYCRRPTKRPTSKPVTITSSNKPTSNKPTTLLPSTTSTNKPSSVLKPTTARPTSRKPTTVKPTTIKPTTVKPTSRKPATVKPTSRKPVSSPSSMIGTEAVSFLASRLKIYHQVGYMWQDQDKDLNFCMDCWDNVCSSGEYIKLQYCNASSSDQTFIGINGTIRPASDKTLCFTIMGYGPATDTDGLLIDTPIQLQQCIPGSSEQQFVRRPGPGIGGYEFSPVGNLNRCLANLHHPKVGERIFPRLCSKAQSDTTGAWITI